VTSVLLEAGTQKDIAVRATDENLEGEAFDQVE
jgi:hypothetical protein